MFLFSKTVQQVAALPFVIVEGSVEVMLVTSRRRGRWVLPKGWPRRGSDYAAAAAREALEEAGVTGQVLARPIGAYRYEKRIEAGYAVGCSVLVYPLFVAAQQLQWREHGQRRTAWYGIGEAAGIVDDADLRRLLRGLAARRPEVLAQPAAIFFPSG